MNEPIGILIGKRIKHLREAAQLTQSELATLTLKSVETISNFERGKTIPSVRTLADMAEKLNVSLRDFFEDTRVSTDAPDIEVAIKNKSRLLNEKDKALLVGIIELMAKRSRR